MFASLILRDKALHPLPHVGYRFFSLGTEFRQEHKIARMLCQENDSLI